MYVCMYVMYVTRKKKPTRRRGPQKILRLSTLQHRQSRTSGSLVTIVGFS